MHKKIYGTFKRFYQNTISHYLLMLDLINEKNIDIIANTCKEVQVSFEGISKSSYENIRGPFYSKVLKSLTLLKERNLRIILAITILPTTMNDINDNLVNFIKELNYNNLEIRLNDEIEMTGNALNMDFTNYEST